MYHITMKMTMINERIRDGKPIEWKSIKNGRSIFDGSL